MVTETYSMKMFGRWGTDGISVSDLGIKPYITVKAPLVPKTGARYASHRFWKSKISIVERLINKLMVPGHKAKKHKISSGQISGKSNTAYRIVERTFTLIENRLKKNPVEVFVKALENAAPREEIIAIEYGGARYPKAVETAPQRRVDLAIRFMTQGAAQKAFGTKKSIEQALTEEIFAAYSLSANSNAISKKNELERQADSSR